jgi:hypothetical protein
MNNTEYHQMTFLDLDGLTPKQRYERSMNELDVNFRAKRDELRKILRKSQLECKHEHTTYYPDASGNNDSWDECNFCGAML